MQVLQKAGIYSEKNSYIYEISSKYKVKAIAVYDATFPLYLERAIKLILPRKCSKNVLQELFELRI